jgi:hypothetical protein
MTKLKINNQKATQIFVLRETSPNRKYKKAKH